jgi:hypothetical protein
MCKRMRHRRDRSAVMFKVDIPFWMWRIPIALSSMFNLMLEFLFLLLR